MIALPNLDRMTRESVRTGQIVQVLRNRWPEKCQNWSDNGDANHGHDNDDHGRLDSQGPSR